MQKEKIIRKPRENSICYFNLYFEGDEELCALSKCNHNYEFDECTEACSKDKMMEAERMRNDEDWEFTLRLYARLKWEIVPIKRIYNIHEKELFDTIQKAKVK